ncbi:MAG: hypothetical protein KA085_17760 [Phenylobacterium sp.]|jgi:hypothetical protein|uniref:hypothetical protein n=1 Tax=Phenylobacterium sp. TaxID=1871053 RepID=UPI001B4DC021|nr:hypothetical protein [Phenylobacterium sp.]MBP7649283.1 hypothetical protein [Phenylobacterium sp.]MBP7817967.1 hypothetical protein [Phenylobacterium sp.]MBP9232254.1 hypothetical protein [Phenylobacterium sp.]MBP9754668.1 hypothetical protein [Phenylobacterium sp.]
MRIDAIGLEVVACVLISAVVAIALKTGRAGFLLKSLDVDRATNPKAYWVIVWAWITLAGWAWYDTFSEP